VGGGGEAVNVETLPRLNPAEHKMLEEFIGQPLTNEAAQMFRREWVLWGAFEQWMRERDANDAAK
jgi:hypothetical protein